MYKTQEVGYSSKSSLTVALVESYSTPTGNTPPLRINSFLLKKRRKMEKQINATKIIL
jgi:hypothetical protein